MSIRECNHSTDLGRTASYTFSLKKWASALRSIRREWLRRRHYRQDLRRMLEAGPHLMEDIGLSLEDARREAAKPFWRS